MQFLYKDVRENKRVLCRKKASDLQKFDMDSSIGNFARKKYPNKISKYKKKPEILVSHVLLKRNVYIFAVIIGYCNIWYQDKIVKFEVIENLKVKKKSLHLSIRGKIVTFHSSHRYVDLVTFTYCYIPSYHAHCTVNTGCLQKPR